MNPADEGRHRDAMRVVHEAERLVRCIEGDLGPLMAAYPGAGARFEALRLAIAQLAAGEKRRKNSKRARQRISRHAPS